MSSSAKRERGPGYWLKRAFWEEQWCVGVVEDAKFWECVANGTLYDRAVRWLPASGKYFLADPCWLSEQEGVFTAECFDYRRRIGRLVIAKASDGRSVPMETLKLNDVHHSYPMVYTEGDEHLVIPESALSGEVTAMRLNRSGKLLDETTILSGYSLVDPTIFQHDGAYWMFANPLNDFDDKLMVFRGDSLTGPWVETSFSPIAIPNCRGAGKIFERSGRLFWPTQFNSESYGGGLILRRILHLTDREFEHDIASKILPDPRGSRPLGFHSFSKGERHHLVDGLRYRFSPLKLLDVLISRTRRRRSAPEAFHEEVPSRASLAKG